MEQDELPSHPNRESQLALEVAALSARVEAMERELAELRADSRLRPRKAAPPPPVVQTGSVAPAVQMAAAGRKSSMEDRIGSQLFSRIGIIALLIAVALFLKWAIDNHWIGPVGRVLAGLIAGTAVVLWSERFRGRGFPVFSWSLKAVGSGTLYLSLWAAFQLYHLLPAAAALGAMILVTAWNAWMAWTQNSELLAAYALVGAFATPLLLATGGNHEVFLFSYLLIIDIATVALVRLKPWPRLMAGAFPITVAFFIAWYSMWFQAAGHPSQVAVTTAFIALFFMCFIFPSLGIHRRTERWSALILEAGLPLANAGFGALGLYSVLQDSGNHSLLPWCAVLFAALYLGLMRLPQTRLTSAIHLALAIVFLTVAIPLKATGQWIIVGWLTEGVALLWVSARLPGPQESEEGARVFLLLRRLACAALLLGMLGVLLQPLWTFHEVGTAFLNKRFATSLYALAALAASSILAVHAPQTNERSVPGFLQIAGSSIVAFNLTAVLSCVRELETVWRNPVGDPEAELQKALAISTFLMVYGAALLAVGFWKRTAFVRWQALLLLVFTIAKAFLYDLRNLSQGYRVLSFLGLGALLMAVSFAYQRDWLALRSSGGGPEQGSAPREGSNP